jgi:hypothetical protein
LLLVLCVIHIEPLMASLDDVSIGLCRSVLRSESLPQDTCRTQTSESKSRVGQKSSVLIGKLENDPRHSAQVTIA